MKAWKHFATITHHRNLVMIGCFRMGIYWQGLTHDLSKYTPTEFLIGARYFQGDKSPNSAERATKGYSEAWMHHKGRNRHHYEYWTDMNRETRTYEPVKMPRKFMVEQVMDRRAACIVYQGDAYTDASALTYLLRSREKIMMHKKTLQELEYLLTMLRDYGETETFSYIKHEFLQGNPFPWELTEE